MGPAPNATGRSQDGTSPAAKPRRKALGRTPGGVEHFRRCQADDDVGHAGLQDHRLSRIGSGLERQQRHPVAVSVAMIGSRQDRVRGIGQDLRTGIDGRQDEAGRQRRQRRIGGRREAGRGVGPRSCGDGVRASVDGARERRQCGRPTGLRQRQARDDAEQDRPRFSRPCGIEPSAERPCGPECREGFGRGGDAHFPDGTGGPGNCETGHHEPGNPPLAPAAPGGSANEDQAQA